MAAINASDISGLMLDKSYFNDVLGVYMTYTIQIAVPLDKMTEYAELYEILTSPDESHTFTLPYNNSTITITARITEVSDVYVRLPKGGQAWKGLRFACTANHPTKTRTLSEVVTMGRAPLPDVASPQINDTYKYTADGWVKQ